MEGHRFQCCVAFFLPPCYFGYKLSKLPYSVTAVCKQILLKSFNKQPKPSSCGAPSFLLYYIKSHLIMMNSIVSLSLCYMFLFLPRKKEAIKYMLKKVMIDAGRSQTRNRKGEMILQGSCSHRSHRRKKYLPTACCYP